VFPSADFTINVSPVRDVIIPLTFTFSPLAPKADTDAKKISNITLASITFRCMAAPLFSS
jgi:hypothetical protein